MLMLHLKLCSVLVVARYFVISFLLLRIMPVVLHTVVSFPLLIRTFDVVPVLIFSVDFELAAIKAEDVVRRPTKNNFIHLLDVGEVFWGNLRHPAESATGFILEDCTSVADHAEPSQPVYGLLVEDGALWWIGTLAIEPSPIGHGVDGLGVVATKTEESLVRDVLVREVDDVRVPTPAGNETLGWDRGGKLDEAGKEALRRSGLVAVSMISDLAQWEALTEAEIGLDRPFTTMVGSLTMPSSAGPTRKFSRFADCQRSVWKAR